jgi:hypothetical protein
METQNRFYKWNGMVDGSSSNEYFVQADEQDDAISGGGSLRNLKRRLIEIVLGPGPTMPSGDNSMADIKKAALEKVLTDNGLI